MMIPALLCGMLGIRPNEHSIRQLDPSRKEHAIVAADEKLKHNAVWL
jgi:hypothetical protein